SDISIFWNTKLNETLGTANPLASTLVNMTLTGNRWERVLADTQQYVAGQIPSISNYTATNNPGNLGLPTYTPGAGIVTTPPASGGSSTPPVAGTRAPRIPANKKIRNLKPAY